MLTKDLISARIKGAKVVPTFVDPTNRELLRLAESYCEVFSIAVGSSIIEIEQALDEAISRNDFFSRALKKLMFDRIKVQDVCESFSEERWRFIKSAQAARRSQLDMNSYIETQEACRRDIWSDGKVDLYGDLADLRKIEGFKELTAEGLLHRYNCALVQGLLIKAKIVSFVIPNIVTIEEKRHLFQQLKFSRLMAKVESIKNGIQIEIGGPLSIFQNAQSYGLRLANFFPHIVQLSKWEFAAEVEYKKKLRKLNLNEQDGLKSHYRERRPYIPDELKTFIGQFNKKTTTWQASVGEDFVDIGLQSYCFPDICLKKEQGSAVYLELFHKWNRGQLEKRLHSLQKNPRFDLIVGYDRTLKKDEIINQSITDSLKIGIKLLEFNNIPLTKSTIELLADS